MSNGRQVVLRPQARSSAVMWHDDRKPPGVKYLSGLVTRTAVYKAEERKTAVYHDETPADFTEV